MSLQQLTSTLASILSAADSLHTISNFSSLHSISTDNYGDFHSNNSETAGTSSSKLRQFEAPIARKFDTEGGHHK